MDRIKEIKEEQLQKNVNDIMLTQNSICLILILQTAILALILWRVW